MNTDQLRDTTNVQSNTCVPTFRRNIPATSSGRPTRYRNPEDYNMKLQRP